MPWNPHKINDADKDLLQYFQLAACPALTTFGHDPTDLGKFLLRMSLSDDSCSSTALLRALLGFSSLHRHGLQSQAGELKVSALRALAAASKGGELGTKEAVQHVAAGMLLYSFEIQQSCCTASHWVWYICGAKEVINQAGLNLIQHRDVAALLDWVYYNDIMARFSLRHWDKTSNNISSTPPSTRSGASNVTPSTVAMLQLLSDLCDAVSVDMRPIQESEDHKSFLKVLDWRIRNVPVATAIDRLYQLATLIYLDRISGALLNQTERVQQYIETAFGILLQLDTCERQFPVFIIGCEARTDGQRTIVLDIIAKTEKTNASRSWLHAKLLLQSIWAQDDLFEWRNGGLEYWDKLSSTMSRCIIPPSFV
ncbi:hypothetical protein EKO27_g6367 [Xylaria grammica]|uniref:Transcription factor domain-containing protein n=1 Tax=Xylaria grammica TaxID=363999 RepID=A0A439D2S2_9PEZI|nr:hypothetical protein EKO27_g6367 [Xylaria grammica]